MLKRCVCIVLLITCFSFTACQEDLPGLNEPIINENISVTVTSVFNDTAATYIITEVKLSEEYDINDGRLFSMSLKGSSFKNASGYNYSCIGLNESDMTQYYLISITAIPISDLYVKWSAFRSKFNPMNKIVECDWKFKLNISDSKPKIKSIEINDGIVEKINLYEDAILIAPTQSIDELKEYDVSLYDKNGESVEPKLNSLEFNDSKFIFACLVLDPKNSEIAKVKIGENEYFIN